LGKQNGALIVLKAIRAFIVVRAVGRCFSRRIHLNAGRLIPKVIDEGNSDERSE
jgi:hypothetical protein